MWPVSRNRPPFDRRTSDLATLDADILLALGSADGSALGLVPSNVHVEAFVDQPSVLAHADLVVHHGGSGTILGALAHGTAQMLLPKGADQFLNADAMVHAGLASVLEPSQATSDTVATLAKTALEHHRPAVDAAREEIAAMRHPAEVLGPLVERLESSTLRRNRQPRPRARTICRPVTADDPATVGA